MLLFLALLSSGSSSSTTEPEVTTTTTMPPSTSVDSSTTDWSYLDLSGAAWENSATVAAAVGLPLVVFLLSVLLVIIATRRGS